MDTTRRWADDGGLFDRWCSNFHGRDGNLFELIALFYLRAETDVLHCFNREIFREYKNIFTRTAWMIKYFSSVRLQDG